MIRAAVFDGPGMPLRFECFSQPKLAHAETLVRVSLCTICGSDLHTFAGRRAGPVPCILGHEPIGVVEQLGSEILDVVGSSVKVGDRVVWAVAISCGRCFFCTRGLPQKCTTLQKYGHEPIISTQGPLGGLTTHCHLVPGTAIVKVPDGLPDVVAAPAGCATATVAAAWSAGLRFVRPGGATSSPQTIVVLGLGMLGLTACAWGLVHGQVVIASDVNASRLAQAKRFGASHVAKPTDLSEMVSALTDGRGADLVLELSGSPAAAKLSLEILRIGGTAVWVGAVFPTDSVAVLPEDVVRRCLTITGIHNYTPRDLAAAIAFLADNHDRFPFAELVARTFPLNEANAAFAFAEAERPVRVAIRCE